MSGLKYEVVNQKMLKVTSHFATLWYPVSHITGVEVGQDRGDQYWLAKALLSGGSEVRLLRVDDRAKAEAAAGELAGMLFG